MKLMGWVNVAGVLVLVSGVVLVYANLTGTDLSHTIGLTQKQLNLAVADSARPPNLDGLRDAETGESDK